MSIAPIIQTVSVKLSPDRAFALFAARMGDWWSKGKTIGKNPHRAIVLEPQPGGRWYEEDEAGTQCDWGKVIAWEPPHRICSPGTWTRASATIRLVRPRCS